MSPSINLGPCLSSVSKASENGQTLHDARDTEGKSLKWFESGLGMVVLHWFKGSLGVDTHIHSYSHIFKIKQNETHSKQLVK